MKKRKLTALLLAGIMVLSLALTGCGKGNTADTPAQSGQTSQTAQTANSGGSTATKGETAGNETITINVYDCAANFQGVQPGWFGKVLKDNFNIELNIIAPNISGDADALYQTRCASGDLGDIIILENAKIQECIDAGLLKDLTDLLPKMPNLDKFNDKITVFNSSLKIDGSKIYALPGGMSDAGPTGYGLNKMNGPFIPWDYYAELGYPEIKDDTDLLNLLKDMMAAHPVNDSGDPCYAFSLWPSWDGGSVENVNQIVPWYGETVNDSLLINAKGDMTAITSDSGNYKKMLKLLFTANQMGLVDPDSFTQGWDEACTKMQNKQVYLFWYWWQTGFWNSPDRAAVKDGYMYVPVASHHYIQTGDASFGDGRDWCIGSKVEGEKLDRIIALFNWMASTEGQLIIHLGIEGFNYRINADGSFETIKENENAMNDNTEVPAEWGGGGYGDGMNKLNCQLVSSETINPMTGEPFAPDRWASYIETSKTNLTEAWKAQFGDEDQVAYIKARNMCDFVANVNICLDSDSSEIGLIRSQCTPLIKDTTWRMIAAKDEAEFEKLWTDMNEQLAGLGWDQVVEFDKAKYKKMTDARSNATK